MTTIATIAADSWSISVGGGWILLMLIGMALCFVFMLGSMLRMPDGRGWAMCGHRGHRQSARGHSHRSADQDITLVNERSER